MYVDGYLLPVKTARKAEYLDLCRTAAQVFLDHGATRVVETWADDVKSGEHTSFPQAVKLEDDETCVFSWIEFPDRATRDACMAKVMEDERMDTSFDAMPVDGARMIFGGFEPLIDERAG